MRNQAPGAAVNSPPLIGVEGGSGLGRVASFACDCPGQSETAATPIDMARKWRLAGVCRLDGTEWLQHLGLPLRGSPDLERKLLWRERHHASSAAALRLAVSGSRSEPPPRRPDVRAVIAPRIGCCGVWTRKMVPLISRQDSLRALGSCCRHPAGRDCFTDLIRRWRADLCALRRSSHPTG